MLFVAVLVRYNTKCDDARLTLQGRWVRGIIDQLQVGPDGRLAVVEHKTRSRPTLPRPAQVPLVCSHFDHT